MRRYGHGSAYCPAGNTATRVRYCPAGNTRTSLGSAYCPAGQYGYARAAIPSLCSETPTGFILDVHSDPPVAAYGVNRGLLAASPTGLVWVLANSHPHKPR